MHRKAFSPLVAVCLKSRITEDKSHRYISFHEQSGDSISCFTVDILTDKKILCRPIS